MDASDTRNLLMPALYLGIDPGKQGGLALIDDAGSLIACEKMPLLECEIFWLLESWKDKGASHVMIERVWSSPQMGVKSAFTFGYLYGCVVMAVTAVAIPWDVVTPQVWQKALGCLSKGDKNVTKRKAQQLFPGVKVNHYIADALLIAEYGRRLHAGSSTL